MHYGTRLRHESRYTTTQKQNTVLLRMADEITNWTAVVLSVTTFQAKLAKILTTTKQITRSYKCGGARAQGQKHDNATITLRVPKRRKTHIPRPDDVIWQKWAVSTERSRNGLKVIFDIFEVQDRVGNTLFWQHVRKRESDRTRSKCL